MRTPFGSMARYSTGILAITLLSMGAGCAGAGAVITPGHRAILFDPKQGGVQHEVLQPGFVSLNCGAFTRAEKCSRVDDFDVTYSTNKEEIITNSAEGLALTLHLAIVYRPIIAELYQLDTEIGPNYYDEVIAPEFKSAARGVFARHSYLDLQKKNEKIENEIEAEVRRRAAGKHIEISSVLLESVEYAPEIAQAVRSKVVAEQEAARRKAATENEHAQHKREMEVADEEATQQIEMTSKQHELATTAAATEEKMKLEADAAEAKLKLESDAEQAKLKLTSESEQKKLEIATATEEETERLASELRTKTNERALAEQQAVIDKVKAQGEAGARIESARGEATARLALATASGEERKAEAASITPLHVMMHAYDALAHLGGNGTTIMLGDFAHIPNFLFPKVPMFNSAFTLPWSPYSGAPVPPPTMAPQPTAAQIPAPSIDPILTTSR